MTTIVAGLFDTSEHAERAKQRLLQAGVRPGDVDVFFNSPPGQHGLRPGGGDEPADPHSRGAAGAAATGAAAGVGIGGAAGAVVGGPAGAAAGAAVGAYVGSLAGALKGTDEDASARDPEPRRPGGVIVAANASRGPAPAELDGILRDSGATLVEQTQGVWARGTWSDFDPLERPRAARAGTISSTHEPSIAMKYELPPLPYPLDALEPHISSETLEYHHGKHHRTYVEKLNQLVKGSPFEKASLEDIVRKATGPIFNNGAQAWNHNFYWQCLSPDGGGSPSGAVAKMIERSFGGFEQFRDKFSESATGLFGSGWTWLARNADGSLEILNCANADNPLRSGKTPLLACDVWEHAYYIDYRNARKDYVEVFWNLVNWQFVNRNCEPAHAHAQSQG